MKFRKIYWVVESINTAGPTTLKGVYTSIQDLTEAGLSTPKECLRLSLVKLDAAEGVLGKWDHSNFSNIRKDLDEYIESGEFSIENCDILANALNA